MTTRYVICGITPSLYKNLLSHTASWTVITHIIYSNSMVDNDMQDFLTWPEDGSTT